MGADPVGARQRRRLLRLYDERVFGDPVFCEFFGGSGYGNYGYWTEGTRSGREAADALVDRLVADLPRSPGAILDVACGCGGTTARLASHFGAQHVTAIDISVRSIGTARTNARGCDFAVMDAARLGFADETFDAVLCVEAAFHFETREEFLREVLRVLRPGGRVLLADVLTRLRIGRVPRANVIRDRDEYEAMLRDLGFLEVRTEDVLLQSWKVFRRRYAEFTRRQAARLRSPRRLAWGALRWLLNDLAITGYLLVAARRP